MLVVTFMASTVHNLANESNLPTNCLNLIWVFVGFPNIYWPFQTHSLNLENERFLWEGKSYLAHGEQMFEKFFSNKLSFEKCVFLSSLHNFTQNLYLFFITANSVAQ